MGDLVLLLVLLEDDNVHRGYNRDMRDYGRETSHGDHYRGVLIQHWNQQWGYQPSPNLLEASKSRTMLRTTKVMKLK